MTVPPSELSPFFDVHRYTISIAAGTVTKVLSQSPNRVAFMVGWALSATLYLWIDSTVSSAKGFQIVSGAPVLLLKYRDLGPWIGNEWWIFSAATAGTVVILESLFGRQIPVGD